MREARKKETLRASSVSRLQSRAWSFSCLARSRLTNYEKRETALSVQQNSSSCTSRCGTQSPPSHLLLWLFNSPRWLSYFLKKKRFFLNFTRLLRWLVGLLIQKQGVRKFRTKYFPFGIVLLYTYWEVHCFASVLIQIFPKYAATHPEITKKTKYI